MARADREDLSAQEERVRVAREDLARSLDDLIADAKAAAKAARSKRGRPNLDDVYACHAAVQRAEESLDLAVYDLQTASGADG